ncbi:fam-m protein [Plasmodium malariae]|uniref:Fam-m protein n=1 Tax=Plasmodium malariae TaxID=5858 RepID=A0A1D3JHF8_PLAMA|nr:fam-m protein [Plasmodium malariae]SBT85799.1 fam-m protein [Plasmodium malariae]
MDQKIKMLFFIKISTFILLTWIFHFNSELSTFNKSINKNYKPSKKLDTRSYRILRKYKKENNSNNVFLKKMFVNNGENNEGDISNNEKCRKGKNKQSNRSLLNKAQYYTEIIDYNNGTFDGKHFHFQKKWIKKKDHDDFLEKNRRICDITLKKIKFRKYRFGVAIFIIFLFLGIGLAILPKLPFMESVWTSMDNLLPNALKEAIETAQKYVNNYLYLILYTALFVILSIILIIGIYKMLRNNEKYNKIKLITE